MIRLKKVLDIAEAYKITVERGDGIGITKVEALTAIRLLMDSYPIEKRDRQRLAD